MRCGRMRGRLREAHTELLRAPAAAHTCDSAAHQARCCIAAYVRGFLSSPRTGQRGRPRCVATFDSSVA